MVEMCSMPSSIASKLEKPDPGTTFKPGAMAADQMAAFNKQYSPSSPQSEDELDTPGTLESATVGSSASMDNQQQYSHALTRNNFHREANSIWSSAQPLVKTYAPAALLVVAFSWLVSKLRRKPQKQRQQQQEPSEQQRTEPEPTLSVYASDFSLEPKAASPRIAQLSGVRCVVAEHVAVQGAVVGCGMPGALQQCTEATESAVVVKKLLNLGVSITGQGSTQLCNYPTVGDNIRNPVGRYRVAGGGLTGAAVAVAVDDADLAVGTDYLGSVRVPAACMGLYGFVCTPGTLGSHSPSNNAPNSSRSSTTDAGDASRDNSSGGTADGSGSSRRVSTSGSGSSSLETIAFVSADLSLTCRVASFLGLPGAANLRHELTQVVVAEDLFQLCEPEMAPGILAVKRAVLAWAGNEQAGSVQLLQFLEANTSSWRNLTPPQTADSNGDLTELPKVLTALKHAAELLYHNDLSVRYGALLEAQPEGDLGSEVAQALAQGKSISQEQLELAHMVQKEVQDVMKSAVKRDVVVVIPCSPAAPPRLDASQAALQSWLQHCHAFSAITALAGCPTVVLPTGALPDGGPLGLAMFGQARTDQRLLAVAHKLTPHIQTELVKLRQQASAEKAGSSQAQGSSSTQDSKAAQVDPKRIARAEKAKGRGNDAYKAGRYMEAIKAYSEAIKQNPTNPVYISNRAMAYLKVFSFEAAEADCNRVLAHEALQPADRVKAFLRRGTARMHKGDLRGARSDFREVLSAEPNNRQAQEELKALRQQERDMEDTRRQHALAAAAAATAGNGAGFPSGMDGWDPATAEMLGDPSTLQQGPAGIGALAGLGASGDPYLGGHPVDAGQFEAMIRSGGMSVVLGEGGEAVCGPDGEPVIVGPAGQELAVDPSGQLRPYTPRGAMP